MALQQGCPTNCHRLTVLPLSCGRIATCQHVAGKSQQLRALTRASLSPSWKRQASPGRAQQHVYCHVCFWSRPHLFRVWQCCVVGHAFFFACLVPCTGQSRCNDASGSRTARSLVAVGRLRERELLSGQRLCSCACFNVGSAKPRLFGVSLRSQTLQNLLWCLLRQLQVLPVLPPTSGQAAAEAAASDRKASLLALRRGDVAPGVPRLCKAAGLGGISTKREGAVLKLRQLPILRSF